MKKSIIILLLFVFTISSSQNSQQGDGRNKITYHGADFDRYATSAIPYDAGTPYVMNVYFTLINNQANRNFLSDQGIIDTPEQVEYRFLECIKFLNKNFSASKIFFKYAGYQIVKNDVIADGGELSITFPPNFVTPAASDVTQYEKVDAMNLIFTNLDILNTDYWTYQNYNMSILSNRILNSPKLERIIVHIMGHCLSLYHTDEAISHFLPSSPLYNFTACEHVTRTQGSLYNADIAGDEVADTPAQPVLQDSFFVGGCGEYIFDSTRVNCISEPYQNLINGNPMNSLQFPNLTNCNLLPFTPGQTKRMRQCIRNSPTTTSDDDFPNLVGIIENTRNSVASLFKPYSMGTIVLPNILRASDNGDGTAKVCRGYNSADFKFQPGFTYTFLEEPDYNSVVVGSATVNDNPVIVHQPAFNCPVRIGELLSSQNSLNSNIGIVETVCRGEICVIEPFINGTDTRTEILGSMNVTVEQLDAIKVKDPELYERLMQQYYHILEKYTASGAKTQEVIYKN